LKKGANASVPRKTIFLTHLATTTAFLLWLGGIGLAPYLKSRASPWAGLVYSLYSPVCHQVADRSLLCFGQPLAVCARCTGIYLGFLLGLVLYPVLRGWRRQTLPAARSFLIVSAPILLDTAANFLRFWNTGAAVRLATGVLWGTILPFYFIPGMADLFLSRRKKRLKSAGASP
jgi:uncharacterized membrane protein